MVPVLTRFNKNLSGLQPHTSQRARTHARTYTVGRAKMIGVMCEYSEGSEESDNGFYRKLQYTGLLQTVWVIKIILFLKRLQMQTGNSFKIAWKLIHFIQRYSLCSH
jgi:hypothetical protein